MTEPTEPTDELTENMGDLEDQIAIVLSNYGCVDLKEAAREVLLLTGVASQAAREELAEAKRNLETESEYLQLARKELAEARQELRLLQPIEVMARSMRYNVLRVAFRDLDAHRSGAKTSAGDGGSQ